VPGFVQASFRHDWQFATEGYATRNSGARNGYDAPRAETIRVRVVVSKTTGVYSAGREPAMSDSNELPP
jgi:hypothetical protein